MGESRACLIDSSIYIFRAWFSLPDNWHSTEGWPLNAVYGYTRFLLELLESNTAVYCAAAFDESLGSCFRNDIYPAYKSSRELPDEALAFQLEACKNVTGHLGIACYAGPRYEADDYLASLARLYREAGSPVSILTRDKDLGQIIQGPKDLWCDYAAGVSLDADAFTDKYGVRPGQFADYLALVGDPVDDVPGVPGVGAKTARKLLQAHAGIDELGLHLDQIGGLGLRGAARIQANLKEHWAQVKLAKQLTVLEENIPGLEKPSAFELTEQALDHTIAYLEELGLGGPLTRRCHSLRRNLPK
ncbi:MAG: 5'-3' exonuclease H3TH domain-containing protein [Halioglobus sp.]